MFSIPLVLVWISESDTDYISQAKKLLAFIIQPVAIPLVIVFIVCATILIVIIPKIFRPKLFRLYNSDIFFGFVCEWHISSWHNSANEAYAEIKNEKYCPSCDAILKKYVLILEG